MAHRTKSKDRCLRCHIRRVLCLCPIIPEISLSTKLIVLIHCRESKRPTNTGHLAALALTNSEVRIRGIHGRPMSTEGLVSPERQSLLFYPSERAQELTSDFLKKINKPITLIVPDGSWRQASKVGKRESVLRDIPHVKLSTGAPTAYQLRRESKIEGLATIEAIARAMGIIENPQVETRLMELFSVMVERTMWSRGKKRAQECVVPIPAKAIQSHNIRQV